MKIIGIVLLLLAVISVEATAVNLLTGLSLKKAIFKTPESVVLMARAEKLIFIIYPSAVLLMPFVEFLKKRRKQKETTK